MDKIAKLLRKITKKERQRIRKLMILIETRQWDGIDIVKIKGTINYYRARKGRFRLVFYITQDDRVIIDDVRVRQEDTYDDF
jgi:mRNA-degrading endonuclease RelE of RelBE toxin-antitoxin system